MQLVDENRGETTTVQEELVDGQTIIDRMSLSFPRVTVLPPKVIGNCGRIPNG